MPTRTPKSEPKDSPQSWATRKEAEMELRWLYGMVAVSFGNAIEAAECVRIRLSMKQSARQLTPNELESSDRMRDDCLRLRRQLVDAIRQSAVVSRLIWQPEENQEARDWDVPISEPELMWLRTALRLILTTNLLRRRILQHTSKLGWDGGKILELRRCLTWNTRTLEWLKPARNFHYACLGETVNASVT